jgi:succinate-acetate transporter protein
MMTAIMVVLSAASLRAEPAFGVLLLLGACRFALTGIYQGSLGGGPVTATVAGWIGLPLAAFSLHAGLALLLEDGAQRTVLPVGRRAGPGPRSKAASPTRWTRPSGKRAFAGSSELGRGAGR